MKCKQGELAFIREAIRKENIGRVVTCSQYYGYCLKGDVVEINKEHWIAPISDNYWVISCDGGISTLYGSSKISYIADTWLTPIRGDSLDTEDTTKILEKELVD